MISEVVVLPDCFDIDISQDVVKSVLNDVLENPIFIIDFEDVNWINYIRNNYLGKHKISDKDKFMQLLSRLKSSKKIFKRSAHGIKINSDQDWLIVGEKSYEVFGLDMLLAGSLTHEACQKNLPVICEKIENIIEDRERWRQIKAPKTLIVKTLKDYENNFSSILMNSIELKIIDPYIGIGFSKKDRFKLKDVDADVLKSFSELLGKNYPNKKTYFEIHTKLDEDLDLPSYQVTMSNEERIDRVREEYKKVRYKEIRKKWLDTLKIYAKKFNHEYTVYFWANAQDNSFHDRYIFTDILGINLGHSIAAKDDTKQSTRWHVLNEYDYKEELKKYEIEEDIFFTDEKKKNNKPYIQIDIPIKVNYENN